MVTRILGKEFEDSDVEGIRSYVRQLPRLTYRKGFAPISPNALIFSYTSDTHWGCCIRCTQSLLANFCIRFYTRSHAIFLNSLGCEPFAAFDDVPTAPLSIHSICHELENLGVPVGVWTTVTQIAPVVGRLLMAKRIPVYTPPGCIVSKVELRKLFKPKTPLLSLLPVMCGMDEFDMRCSEFLSFCYSAESGLGAVIGVEANALYLVGERKGKLLYFDPHTTLDSAEGSNRTSVLFKASLQALKTNTINPSLMVGFMWWNVEEMERDLGVIAGMEFSPLSIVEEDEFLVMEQMEDAESWDIIEYSD